jgi:hypothetical protein
LAHYLIIASYFFLPSLYFPFSGIDSMSVRFCSDECQLLHWKAGHMNECKYLSRERKMFVLVKQSAVIPKTIGGGYITRRKGSFQKQRHVGFFYPFTVKVIYLEDDGILWLYDKTRECDFFVCLDYCDIDTTSQSNALLQGHNNSSQNNRHYFKDLIDKVQACTVGKNNNSHDIDWTSFSNDNSTTDAFNHTNVLSFTDTTSTTMGGVRNFSKAA